LDINYPTGKGVKPKTLVALVNPTTFEESFSPQYAKRPVLGLSHEIVQYIRTNSREISMELWFSYQVLVQRGQAMRPEGGPIRDIDPVGYRNIFASMAVPAGPGLAPPLVDVLWPHAHLYFRGVVSSLSFRYEMFSSRGHPLQYTISVTFLEVARDLMPSTAVAAFGMGYAAAKFGTPKYKVTG
jgi:hypothetical protein